MIGLAAARIGRGNQPGIGGELLGGTERADIIDLGVNQLAENSPIQGIVFRSFTLAFCFVIARIVAYDCLIRALMSSMKARPRSIWMRSIGERVTPPIACARPCRTDRQAS
jgi:hypothetical protein